MADQDYVASYSVDIDEAGAEKLQNTLLKNEELADSVSKSFGDATKAIQEFITASPTISTAVSTIQTAINVVNTLRSSLGNLFSGNNVLDSIKTFLGLSGLNESGESDSLLGANGTKEIKVDLDLDDAKKDAAEFEKELEKPTPLSADASGITSAAKTAIEQVRSLFSSPFIMTVIPSVSTDTNPQNRSDQDQEQSNNPSLRMSTGGRFSKPTSVEVAEDGDTEYIIPIKKENRALPLLKQLLGELSPEARKNLLESSVEKKELDSDIGKEITDSSAANSVSRAGTLGTTTNTVTQNNNQNVSAPMTINVNASGASADKIGESIYNTAERYLVRTLKEVFA